MVTEPAAVARSPRTRTPQVLTVSRLCERWQCCRLTVMKAIWDGTLKAFRLGRNWRVLLVEVERFEQRGGDASR